jgi:hypothetical protein
MSQHAPFWGPAVCLDGSRDPIAEVVSMTVTFLRAKRGVPRPSPLWGRLSRR